MSLLANLLRRPVRLTELKTSLLRVERDRRRKLAELQRLAGRQRVVVERIREGRRDGNSIEVDYLWEELKALRTDVAYVRREARVLNLEGIALKRYVRALERLERAGDKERASKLLERIRSSDLDRRLASLEVKDEEYIAELDAIFDEIGLEVGAYEDTSGDPEKDRFLEEIDALNAAEANGDLDAAQEREGVVRSLVDPIE